MLAEKQRQRDEANRLKQEEERRKQAGQTSQSHQSHRFMRMMLTICRQAELQAATTSRPKISFGVKPKNDFF